MFNLTGSEIAFLVLIGLIVLGPEKLPDAVRKFTKAYNEFKKMAGGFQGEMKQAFEEPMRELRGTAEAVKKAAEFDLAAELKESDPKTAGSGDSAAIAPARPDGGLNFGTTKARRQPRQPAGTEAAAEAQEPAE